MSSCTSRCCAFLAKTYAPSSTSPRFSVSSTVSCEFSPSPESPRAHACVCCFFESTRWWLLYIEREVYRCHALHYVLPPVARSKGHIAWWFSSPLVTPKLVFLSWETHGQPAGVSSESALCRRRGLHVLQQVLGWADDDLAGVAAIDVGSGGEGERGGEGLTAQPLDPSPPRSLSPPGQTLSRCVMV